MPSQPNFRSRDQLLVSGLLAGESFHMIVNHYLPVMVVIVLQSIEKLLLL